MYYHILKSDVPESFLLCKRENNDGDRKLFKESFLQHLSVEQQLKAVSFDMEDDELREWLRNPVNGWEELPTAEEIEAQAKGLKDGKIRRLYSAVERTRLRYAPDLSFQDQAYLFKAKEISEWDGTDENAPNSLKTVAERFGQTLQEAAYSVSKNAVSFPTLLLATETLREKGLHMIDLDLDIQPVLSALDNLEEFLAGGGQI
jgi:hypothetical protein